MMQNSTQTEVIIVGAGPTGLSLAAQLMRYNIDFVILDKKEGVTNLSKALVVQARTLELYDQIGLAQKAIEGGKRVEKVALLHDGQVRARLNFSGFGEELSPFPFFLIFEQSKTEQLFYEHLQHNGQAVQWQSELESLTQDTDSVSTLLKTANGETQTLNARYLVGCDGANSLTRHLLGLHMEGSTYPRLFYVADIEMEIEADDATFYATAKHDSFMVMFPMPGEKHWRLIGNLPEYNAQVNQEVGFDQVEPKIKQLLQRSLKITTLRWFSTYKVHTRHVERFSSGRCFLAGDAAHLHTPVGGQGMNTGIQDTYNLAWKMAMVLRGSAGNSLLNSYNEERLENAKRLLQTTDQAFDLVAGDQWYLQFFRDNILPGLVNFTTQFGIAKEFLFPMISEIGINYRNSSLSRHQGASLTERLHQRNFKIKAGDRMPYFLVDDTNIYDKLRGSTFHLLAFSNQEQSSEDLMALDQEYSNFIDFNWIPLSSRVAEIFGSNSPFKVLLRPDNYIALISIECSLDELKTYFNQLH